MFHLGSQLPALLRLLVVDSCFAVLFIRILPNWKFHYWYCTFLLYGSRSLHPSIFRLSARHVCPQTSLSVCLLHLYDDVRWIFNSRLPYLIYYIPNHSWHLFRNGYSRRKHGSDRHYAIFPPWRRFRLLRAYQQYSYVHRADVRTVSARCRSLFCYDLLLRIRFLHFGFSMCQSGKNAL